ncbi:hypothetical protein ccbrp13_02640 [Ktedonobacteria bacterium brp13]|nr:hypothetical protein ccbrp13_02640 [Ktedonobacteria bacterium brp13]
MTHRWFNEQLLLIVALLLIATFSICFMLPELSGYLSTISILSFILVGSAALVIGCIGFITTHRQGY